MKANRRRDTGPERALRSALHRRGLRFRVDYPVTAGVRRTRPDIVFPRARLAVYMDGCFWHRCPIHGTEPQANTAYWKPKLDANAARDAAETLALEAAGWTVERIWEHVSTADAADSVVRSLNRLRSLAVEEHPWRANGTSELGSA